MKTFIKQVENACKNYKYYRVIRTMQLKDDFENTKTAIVSIRESDEGERYYTIFYKYKTMKKPDHIGYFQNLYDDRGECIYNSYIDACEELQKFAY